MSKLIKRILDLIISFFGIIFSSPLILFAAVAIFMQDRKSPFYFAPRVGKNGNEFTMFKIRTMVVDADKSGIDSTSGDDLRVTKLGRIIRKIKIDELTQLLNVLKGEMSLVGPRPNVKRDTDIYTNTEKKLLSVKPGITDFASIVFADEGEILSGKENPDIAYNQLIRPGKSELGLFYINNTNIKIDVAIITTTIISIFSRSAALKINVLILKKLNAPIDLIDTAKRNQILFPKPPPGSNQIVTSRKV
jgi:lipopolysaccharide/colanic/teichoic acid biosynthesis glycosyltransferase